MRITRWILVGVAAMAAFGILYRLVAGRTETEESLELKQLHQSLAA
jgi:hypothetical protein